MRDTVHMPGEARGATLSTRKPAFLYKFNAMTVGAAFASLESDRVFIQEVVPVPVPPAKEAGAAIIEAIVRWSRDQGRNGMVELPAMTSGSRGACQAIGFRGDCAARSRDSIRLNPGTSALRQQASGKWTLRNRSDGRGGRRRVSAPAGVLSDGLSGPRALHKSGPR